MFKKLLFITTLIFSVNAFAEITATDPNETNFEIDLAPGEAGTFQIQFDAADGDEIRSARVRGSGMSLITDCVQVFSSPNLQCIAEVSVAASNANITRRIDFSTNTPARRIRVNISVNRDTTDPIDPTEYASSLSPSTGNTLDFGTVSSSVNQRIYITNTGNQPTETIAPINLTTSGFNMINNTCSGRVIRAGNTCRLIVEFNPETLFSGTYNDTINIHPISDNSSPLSIAVQATIAAAPVANIEIDAGFTKVDPTACLALSGVNPSECYYEADLPTEGITEIGSVSCDGGTPNTCSVLISKKRANEPVEFLITVRYTDEVTAAPNPANFSHTITPSTTNGGEILMGNSLTQSYTVENTSVNPMPLPIEVSLVDPGSSPVYRDAIIQNNTCASLAADLAPGATCTFNVRITPTTVFASNSVNIEVEAVTNIESATLSASSRDPNIQFLDTVASNISANDTVYTIDQDTISFTFNAIGDLGNPMSLSGTITANFGSTNFPLTETTTGVYTGGPFPFSGFTSGPYEVRVQEDGADLGVSGFNITARTDIEYLDPVASSLVLNDTVYTIDQDSISFTFNSINDDAQAYSLTPGTLEVRINGNNYALTETTTGVYTAGPTLVSGLSSGATTAEVFKDGVSVGVSQNLTLRTEVEYLDPLASSVVPNDTTYILDEDSISVTFNSVNDDGQAYDFSGTFTATLGSISIPLTQSATGIYIGGPVAVAGISTGTYNVEVLRNGVSLGVQASVDVETAVQLSNFGPRYPNGANWGYWVRKFNLTACTASFGPVYGPDFDCYHGGEAKTVEVSNADCSIHTIEDSLGVFDWTCDDSNSPTKYHSSLGKGKGLQDLIDFSNNTFKQNDIVLKENGTEIERNTNPVWWTNPIISASTDTALAHVLDQAGAIYVVNQSLTNVKGYNIDANNVSFVINKPYSIAGVNSVPRSSNGSGDPTNPIFNKTISSGSNNYLWIEGEFTDVYPDAAPNSNQNFASAIYIYNAKYVVLNNVEVRNITKEAAGIISSKFILVRGSKFHDIFNYEAPVSNSSRFQFGGIGLSLGRSSDIRIVDSQFYNNRKYAIGWQTMYYVSGAAGPPSTILIKDSVVAGSATSTNEGTGACFHFPNNMDLLIENSIISSCRAFAGTQGQPRDSDSVITRSVISGTQGVFGISMIANVFPDVNTIGSAGFSDYATNYNNISINNSYGFWFDGIYTSNGMNVGDLTSIFMNRSYYRLFNISQNINYIGDLMNGYNLGTSNNPDCSVANSPGIDVVSGPCISSEAIFVDVGTVDYSQSFVGAVSDSVNSSDVGGNVSNMNPNTLDWINFENRYRIWRPSHNPLVSGTYSFSNCYTGSTCMIFDYSLRSSDTLFKNYYSSEIFPSQEGQACPAAVNGDNFEVSNTGSQFLIAAVEIISDDFGNNNGLCEANEECIYMPNHGAYQGHGELVECQYNASGGVSGVKMYGYPNNGR